MFLQPRNSCRELCPFSGRLGKRCARMDVPWNTREGGNDTIAIIIVSCGVHVIMLTGVCYIPLHSGLSSTSHCLLSSYKTQNLIN